MPAYYLPQLRAQDARDNVVRMILLPARAQTARSHHAAVGDEVYLKVVVGGADPVQDVEADPRVCILRARLILTSADLVRAIDVRWRESDEHAASAQVFAHLLAGAEHNAAGEPAVAQQALAALAGFTSWGALYRFLARKSAPGDTDDRLDRELIVWSART